LKEFDRICQGILMLGEKPPRSVDEAVATGEKLSAGIVAALLECRGVPAAAVNGSEVIVTDAAFGNASPILDQTRARAEKVLGPHIAANTVPVVTGFNGATADGRPTTLGRGGSDFSASILAAVLDAEELWIWTDVDGIMTADPRVVADAAVLEEVSYNEAAELAYNGAKVLHPRTLAPLIEKQIPVWSKNSFRPELPGTKIVPRISDASGVRAITSLARVAMITIEAVNASMQGAQLMARALDALARVNVELLLLSRSSYRQNFCMLVRSEELEMAMESLESGLALELAHGYLHPIAVDESVGLLAIVGEGMRGTPGLAGRLFTAISREKINIIAIAQGSSELTIAIVVKRDMLDKAVRAVHAEYRLGERKPTARQELGQAH
jgi:aspartate kinase